MNMTYKLKKMKKLKNNEETNSAPHKAPSTMSFIFYSIANLVAHFVQLSKYSNPPVNSSQTKCKYTLSAGVPNCYAVDRLTTSAQVLLK